MAHLILTDSFISSILTCPSFSILLPHLYPRISYSELTSLLPPAPLVKLLSSTWVRMSLLVTIFKLISVVSWFYSFWRHSTLFQFLNKHVIFFSFNLGRCCYFLLQNLSGILWLILWELGNLYDCEWLTVCPIQIPQLYLIWEIHERLRPPFLQNEQCPPWYLIHSSPSVAPGKWESFTPTVASVRQQLCHGGF